MICLASKREIRVGMSTVRKHIIKRFSGWMALVAMLAQVLLSTFHVAAVAATLSGPLTLKQAPEPGLGIMVICTSNGLVKVLPDGADPASDSENPTSINLQCPVCGSAATGLFVVPDKPMFQAPSCRNIPIIPQHVIILDNEQARRLDVIRSPPSHRL